jgi:hypothetical protein
MPNTFAYVALFSWPFVVFVLFRSMSRASALIWSILGGYLLLPYGVGINPPVLPTIDKTLIPALSAAVMCVFAADAARGSASERAPYTRQRAVVSTRPGPVPQPHTRAKAEKRSSSRRIEAALLLVLIVTAFVTVFQNTEPYASGPRVLPGLKLYDAFSIILNLLVTVLPFLLARRYLALPDQHVLLLRGLCLAGLFYSLPALFEARMSPQLSHWTYGFLAQQFAQAIREGGFRPVVFLQHGLWLAIFLSMAVLAASALWRHEQVGGRWLVAGLWLLATLVLCHSLGALAIAILLLPIVLFVPVHGQMIAAAGVAFVVLFYPMLRGANLIPVDRIVSVAGAISPDRAASLEFRLKNEDILLAHANAKPLAGWGGWGRSRVFDQNTGDDIAVTDGMWIIVVGQSGWLGYLAKFGLLTAPIFLLTLHRRRLGVSPATSGLCVVLAANLIDLIANATLTPVTWLIAGALMGRFIDGTAHDAGRGTRAVEAPAWDRAGLRPASPPRGRYLGVSCAQYAACDGISGDRNRKPGPGPRL